MCNKLVFQILILHLCNQFNLLIYEIREEIHAEGCQYHVHGVLVQEGAWQMLPSEVIGYDAAVGVPVTEKIRCTVQLFPS